MDQIADLTQSIENKIDRSTWQTWKFSDLAENIVEKVVPKNSGLEHYIGLEHLDSGSLHIKRFGETASLVGDKLKIYKDDLIFAKRNAYLKRVAIAEFDAVASAHSLVLRAKPENVLPEFLPFFTLSETFWEKAIEISVGSLSPTINWKALAKQEFLLPPKDQQAQLAELLWALDNVLEKLIVLSIKNDLLAHSLVNYFFKRNKLSNSSLETIADIKYGITINSRRNSLGFEIPYLRVANVSRDCITLDELKTLECTQDEINRYTLENKDVLIVEGHADVSQIGRAALWIDNGVTMLHQNHIIRARCGGDLLPEILVSYINSSFGKSYFQHNAKSTSGLNTINSSVVKKLKVPIIDMKLQNGFLQKKEKYDINAKVINQHILNTKKTLNSVINHIF